MSAKDMFYPEGKDFSKAEERAFAREELVYNVTEDILIALEDLDITKKELARRLGRSRSFVTQTLSGARNMTLGTLSDICFSIGAKPKVTLTVDLAEDAVFSWENDNIDFSINRDEFIQQFENISENIIDYRNHPAWENQAA